jgi:hypothetical protein
MKLLLKLRQNLEPLDQVVLHELFSSHQLFVLVKQIYKFIERHKTNIN